MNPDDVLAAAEMLAGAGRVATFGVGGSSTSINTVSIPAFMSQGNYYIGMIVEGGTNENDFGDNSAFDAGSVLFTDCPLDFDNNGLYDLNDISTFVAAFTGQAPLGDLNNDGLYDLGDIVFFVDNFVAGCP